MGMKLACVLAAVLWAGAVGCKGDGDSGKASGAPAAAAKVTKAQLEDAKKLMKPFAAWNDTLAKVTAKLGEPHGKDGDAVFWRAVEGDKCAKLSMAKKGDEVGTTGIVEYDKAMKGSFDKCVGGG